MRPTVSVIITVHNGARYLGAAIDSIQRQTLGAWELLIIDDASTDRTPTLLDQLRDHRIRTIRLPRNRGPFVAANVGLAHARGHYLARLDADDLAMPERLERQVAFLRQHRHIGIVGSAARLIDANGREHGLWVLHRQDVAIRWHCLLRPPFIHSSVMMRASVLRNAGLCYNGRLRIGGDYELWPRVLETTQAANLPTPLVAYRVWKGGITGSRRATQRRIQNQVSRRTLMRWLPEFELSPRALSELRRWLIADYHHGTAVGMDGAAATMAAARYTRLWQLFEARYDPRHTLTWLARLVQRRVRAGAPEVTWQ